MQGLKEWIECGGWKSWIREISEISEANGIDWEELKEKVKRLFRTVFLDFPKYWQAIFLVFDMFQPVVERPQNRNVLGVFSNLMLLVLSTFTFFGW